LELVLTAGATRLAALWRDDQDD